MGGLIAGKMGLPVEKFILSTNENNEVPEFLRTGDYNSIVPSRNCISSAMNVGHPSNLARIVTLYGGIMDETGRISKEPDLDHMRKELGYVSVSDEDTRKTMEDAFRQYNLLLEPHGAVAWKGVLEFNRNKKQGRNSLFISLETAHPAKFPDEIFKTLGFYPELPSSLSGLDQKAETYFSIENSYDLLKKFILKD
jgi:threonine synthase